MRHWQRTVGICLVGTVLSLSSGCITFWGPEDMRRMISVNQDVKLKKEMGIGVDGLTLGVASLCVGRPLPAFGITSVEAGVYKVSDAGDFTLSAVELPADWDPVVKMRQGDQQFRIYMRLAGSSIRAAVVLIRDDDKLTIVRINGRMEKVIDWAFGFGVLGMKATESTETSDEPPAETQIEESTTIDGSDAPTELGVT